jgi:carboxyl-terminal processing protease
LNVETAEAADGVERGENPSPPPPRRYSRYEKLTSFARSLALIEREYVLPVDGEALVEGAMLGMVDSLDPHTTYLPPDEAKMLLEDIDGSFGGVGIVVSLRAAETGRLQLEILEVLDGGPARAAGLAAGDVIVSIEGRTVAEYVDLFEAISTMRGPVGSEVSFGVEREGDEPREVRLTRATIESEAVAVERVGDDVGVIRLRDFQAQSTAEVREALRELEVGRRGGVSALVLDLRDNGGGLLGEAIGVVDLFLSRGIIVQTRGRQGVLVAQARATALRTYRKIPLVVLINKGSASASEIVAAALQDHGRAAIVGERSYGKGSVQSPYVLPNGGILKLTTALYYSPKDRVIQAAGVMPDVVADGSLVGRRDTRPDIVPEDQVEGHLDPANFGREQTSPARPGPVSEEAAAPTEEEVARRQLEVAIAQVKLIRKLQR